MEVSIVFQMKERLDRYRYEDGTDRIQIGKYTWSYYLAFYYNLSFSPAGGEVSGWYGEPQACIGQGIWSFTHSVQQRTGETATGEFTFFIGSF